MSIIDNRLAMVEALSHQQQQLLLSDPHTAVKVGQRKAEILQELEKDVGPLMALCKPWAPRS
jgi:hypothetical protein